MKLGLVTPFISGFNYKNNSVQKFSGMHNIPNSTYSLPSSGALNNCTGLPVTSEYIANYLPKTPAFTAASSLSFRGGYSLNLKDTIENTKCVYPPDIKEMAEFEIEDGNLENKRLVDIHKEKYGKINQMQSLAQVQEEFPEFKDVLSDSEADYNRKSFIYKVKNGEHEWFDEDKDVALQLLQMYWADGMSKEQIKEYTDGVDITSVLKRLHIPSMNNTYNYVLQLSDENYNAKITKKMSEKQKGIKKHRLQKEVGGVVLQKTSRGPMSEEQKQNISEGLARYYAEHPEKATEQSERMKQYYEEHPEFKERLHNVLITAWGLDEAKSVRKKMSKFFGKKDITAEEFAKLNLDGDNNEEKKTLKRFWEKNAWAKERWSVCMKKAWEIAKAKETDIDAQKEEPEYDCAVNLYPPSLKKDMKKWFRKNGYDLDKIPETSYQAIINFDDKPLPKSNEYAHNAISAYFSDMERENLRADVMQIGLFKVIADRCSYLKNSTRENAIYMYLQRELMDENYVPLELSTQEAMNIYTSAVANCYKEGLGELAQKLQNSLEDAYKILEYDRKKDLQKIIHEGIMKAKALDMAANVQNTKPSNFIDTILEPAYEFKDSL